LHLEKYLRRLDGDFEQLLKLLGADEAFEEVRKWLGGMCLEPHADWAAVSVKCSTVCPDCFQGGLAPCVQGEKLRLESGEAGQAAGKEPADSKPKCTHPAHHASCGLDVLRKRFRSTSFPIGAWGSANT